MSRSPGGRDIDTVEPSPGPMSLKPPSARRTTVPARLSDKRVEVSHVSPYAGGIVAKRKGLRTVGGGCASFGWSGLGEIKSIASTNSERAHSAGLLLNVILDIRTSIEQEAAIRHAFESRGRDDAINSGRRIRSLHWLSKLTAQQLDRARCAVKVAGRPSPRASLDGVPVLGAPLEHLQWLRQQIRLSSDRTSPTRGRCFLLPSVRSN
jgi:hypothetical protein